MISCPTCHTDNLDGTSFCLNCGQSLAASGATGPTTIFPSVACLHCGAATALSSVNCAVCGWSLSPTVTRPVTPVPPSPLSSPVTNGGSQGFKTRSAAWLRRFGFGAPATVVNLEDPFTCHRTQYEVAIPLASSFRFVHEPVGAAKESGATRFVGRENELESLAERILFSDGGSFLVTGYRGVGKTSFINQAVAKLEAALPWAEKLLGETRIIDIYLNVARPVQPSELMHHIIRRLHDRLIEKDVYGRLDQSLRDHLALAYHRTSVNMARKLAEASEKSFGFNEASIGGDLLKAAVKVSWMSKRSQTRNYEMTYLGYDDKAAEHDIMTIARRLSAGYAKPARGFNRVKQALGRKLNGAAAARVRLKIVFVFDELDKLEEFTVKADDKEKPAIDLILGALKNLFTTSGVSFVFVAGKDLQERWLDDVGRGDSVYESVFSYDKYLPCLWADAEAICDGLVDASQPLDSYQRQVFTEFKKYLAYKGRGIPRRIIRTFNEYVEWNGHQPLLALTRQSIRRIRCYAALQDALEARRRVLFGDAHEETVGTQSDKRRLGVYYLIDWMSRQGTTEFTLNDVLTASRRLSAKIALAEELAPRVAEEILKILREAEFIELIERSPEQVLLGDAKLAEEKRYRIVPRRLVELGGMEGEAEEDARLISKAVAPQQAMPTRIGRYRILDEIGRGGMGVVYRAADEQVGREVALKVLQGALASDPTNYARFEREAKVMAALNHPGVVRLYEWNREGAQLYIAMEYLDGITLEAMLAGRGKLDLNLTVAIARPVAEAASYVHEQGFIRNDIKPANIMLTRAGRVCLLDFGISKPSAPPEGVTAVEVTANSQALIGTPQFMAPEQIASYTADERSDVYALGIVLYKMLTGEYPFEGGNLYDIIRRQVEEAPVPPSTHVALPPEADALVLKCLAKNPAERFQTMAELAEALSALTAAAVDLKAEVERAKERVEEVRQIDEMSTMAGSHRANFDAVLGPTMAAALPDAVASSGPPPVPMAMPPAGAWASAPPPVPVAAPSASPYVAPPPAQPELPATIAVTVSLMDEPRLVLLVGSMSNIENVTLGSMERGQPTGVARYYFRLYGPKVTIGRISNNDVVLRDPKVSRYHAALIFENERWFIEDANSAQATFVNGRKVVTTAALQDGDQIQIGDFVFAFYGGPTKQEGVNS